MRVITPSTTGSANARRVSMPLVIERPRNERVGRAGRPTRSISGTPLLNYRFLPRKMLPRWLGVIAAHVLGFHATGLRARTTVWNGPWSLVMLITCAIV